MVGGMGRMGVWVGWACGWCGCVVGGVGVWWVVWVRRVCGWGGCVGSWVFGCLLPCVCTVGLITGTRLSLTGVGTAWPGRQS